MPPGKDRTWEVMGTRVERALMDEVRGVWRAEVMRGRVRLTLRAVIEEALRREVRRAKKRGLEVVPVARGPGHRARG